jgi:Ca-activated chloride channel homolog
MPSPGPQYRCTNPFCLCLLAAICLGVQALPVNAQEPDEVIRVRTDLVALPVIVTDEHKRRVPNLQLTDFELTDDGQARKIDYFASGAEYIALEFLLDNSGSLREQLIRQRDAALELFSRFGPRSLVSVLKFGRTAKVVAPFTREVDQARSAFDQILSLSERTAIFDSAITGINSFAARERPASQRRIIILISDGLDTASSATATQVIDLANRENVSFYVIQLPLFTPQDGRLVPRSAAKGFCDLAEKTGGKSFVAGNAQTALNPNVPVDLTPVFNAIEEDLRSQYVLGFYPAAAARDGQPHRVAISLNPAKNTKLRVVQTKTTYILKK